MLVPDDPLFKQNSILLNIANCSGDQFCVDADKRWSIDLLKIKAVAHFLGVEDCSKQSLYYKIVSVRNNTVLDEQKCISGEEIVQGDELLLLKKRMDIPEFEDPKKQSGKLKAPTAVDILAATQHVSPRNVNTETQEEPTSAFFQMELRKILISLIDTAHRLHCMDPGLNKLFENSEKKEAEQTVKPTAPKLNYNETTLRQLKDMGFSEHLAISALHKNNNVPSEAIQWLIEHESDPEVELGLEVTEATELSSHVASAAVRAPMPNSSNQKAATLKPPNAVEASASGSDVDSKCASEEEEKSIQNVFSSALNKLTGQVKVQKLMTCYKDFARANFVADEQAIQHLREMGFARDDVLDALRVNDNKQDVACEWLLSEEHVKWKQDIEDGLNPDGSLYKAITDNSTVQLGLQNPLSLIAFLMMLESPNSSTQRWVTDVEIGPMLATISNIYHAERRAQPPIV